MIRTSSITTRSMVGIVGRAPPVDRKSVMFVFCLFYLSPFRITKSVITETLLSSVIFKTVTVPLHR